MADDDILEERIRERAFKIWIEEGQPYGRDREHWELAKLAIAEEDGMHATLQRPKHPTFEPIEAIKNQGEFPTLVDQGEGIAPTEREWR
jgi:hypothetical protein